MLQQTQVDRVLPKYAEWLDKYPSLRRARRGAGARGDRRPGIRSATTSARGGCSRSRAKSVAKYGGQLPSDEATLLSFKGIGAYTAGAIRSFAFRERAAILDTNVARVLFRVFVAKGDPKSHAMKRHLWTVSETLVPIAARLRLQPGADGLRRDGLRRAQPEVPGLPDDEGLPRLPVHARSHDDDRRDRRGHRARRPVPRHQAAAGRPPRRATGSFPAASATPASRSTPASRASCARSWTSRRASATKCSRPRTPTPTAASSCTSSAASCTASRGRSSVRRCAGSTRDELATLEFPPADAELIQRLTRA